MWFRYSWRKMAQRFANDGDPDQVSRSAAADLHCLHIVYIRIIIVSTDNFYLCLTKLDIQNGSTLVNSC